MSTIISKKINGHDMNLEIFNSADECVRLCRTREITSGRFSNMQDGTLGGHDSSWFGGIKNYDEALDLLHTGYQPTVDSMRGVFKANVSGEGKRFSFQNNIAGFAPVVPLALKGVPNSMIDMRMKPIKAKVVDIYMDMTASCGTSAEDITEASKKVLSAVIELERQGYRFNLYVGSAYCDNDADVLAIRVKAAEQPLDLKRISFPMTHTAFFRVIGFDWYSRFPIGKYRFGYGTSAHREYGKKATNMFRELFGKKNMIYFSVQELIRGTDKDSIVREVLENGKRKD